MIQKLYSVYDSAAEVFSPPFVCKTLGLALRMFEDLANDRNTTVGQHPADHTLFELGEFDDGSGWIEAERVPKKVASALEYQRETPAPLLAAASSESAENGKGAAAR